MIFGFLGRQSVPLLAGDLTGFAGDTACGVDKEPFTHLSILFFSWILNESEDFICKAFKGEAIVHYAEPLITPQMKASGSPAGL